MGSRVLLPRIAMSSAKKHSPRSASCLHESRSTAAFFHRANAREPGETGGFPWLRTADFIIPIQASSPHESRSTAAFFHRANAREPGEASGFPWLRTADSIIPIPASSPHESRSPAAFFHRAPHCGFYSQNSLHHAPHFFTEQTPTHLQRRSPCKIQTSKQTSTSHSR